MIAIKNKVLQSEKSKNKLAELQQELDSISEIAEKIVEADRLWSNRISNQAFDEIRKELGEMNPGNNRCCYCEDASAYTIEHFYPKSIYPEKTFVWENYLYICGHCNTSKNAQFPIFINTEKTQVNIANIYNKNDSAVLLNPRFDNPLIFIELDFQTFLFVESVHISNKKSEAYLRANYTLNVLKLNPETGVRGEVLKQQRETAFHNYRSKINEYKSEKAKCQTDIALQNQEQRFKREIQKMDMPIVWQEMKRQHSWYPFLLKLFKNCEEALSW